MKTPSMLTDSVLTDSVETLSPRPPRRKRPSPAAQKRLCEKWAAVPIGTPVNVRLDDGTIKATATRSESWLLGHGAAVISVDGITGGYLLDRVSLRKMAPSEDAVCPRCGETIVGAFALVSVAIHNHQQMPGRCVPKESR